MFEVEVTHDRDLARAEAWVRETYDQAHRVAGHGAAFARAHEPATAIARFAEDRAAVGSVAFVRLRLGLAEEWRDRALGLDPAALEGRLLRAAERALGRELPRHQGVYAVRYEGRDARPVVHAYLSPRLADGGSAPMLRRTDVTQLEARWDRSVQQAFGFRRSLDGPHRVLPEHERLRDDLRHATDRFAEVVQARFRGEASQDDVRWAGERAHAAQQAWARARTAPVEPERSQFGVVSLRIEGGRSYLGQLSPRDQDLAIDRAVRVAAGPAGRDARIVHWPAGDDHRVAVLLGGGRREVALEPVRAALVERLGEQIGVMARHYDSRGERDLGVPGRVVAVDATPARAAAVERAAGGAPDRGLAVAGQPQPWQEVRFRVERGAEYLQRVPEEGRRSAIDRAVDRAFPFLAREGVRSDWTSRTEGPVLDVRVRIAAEAVQDRPRLVEGPVPEFRFARELQRAAVEHGALRDGVGLAPLRRAPEGAERSSGLAQAVARVTGERTSPALLGPDREVRRGAWERLAQAVPAPLRAGMALSRVMGHFRQQD